MIKLTVVLVLLFSSMSTYADRDFTIAKEQQQKFLEGETYRVKGVSFKMKGIPQGSFDMGDANGMSAEKPVHSVQVPAFRMMQHEVTWAMYQPCINSGACPVNSGDEGDNGWGKGSRPVIEVSYNDIINRYIPWLNKQTGQIFRLPSEAEWEYAARAGSRTKYSWGNSINCSHARYGYYSDECGKQEGTDPVKSFSANAFGLYDMHGNVWEWTQDCYNDSYSGAPNNGEAWASADCSRRVLRGGSWFSKSFSLRSAVRNGGAASSRRNGSGFRLVQGC